MPPKSPKQRRHAKREPRPGTFAAWVCQQPVDELPSVTAKRARAAGFAQAKSQQVSNVRWYYGLTGRGAAMVTHATVERVPVGAVAAAVARAQKLSAVRGRVAGRAGRAGRVAPVDPNDVTTSELYRVIGRHGVDAARRAIAYYEAGGHIERVLAQEA